MENNIQIDISNQIESIHTYFHDYANRQVNYAYTLRNWLIGMYLFEVEQKGKERAEYVENLHRNIAKDLKSKKIKGMSFMMLHNFKKFFQTYPSIVQSVTEQLQPTKNHELIIIQSMIGQFKPLDYNNIQSSIGESELKNLIENDVKSFENRD